MDACMSTSPTHCSGQELAVIAKLWAQVRSAFRTEFGRNAIWFSGLSAFDRVIAVVQTVVISRALGITEYGVYGLLFGTIGFVASVAGMQMGLTATVFVAKYRIVEKAKAAAVISIVGRFGLVITTIFVAASLPFSSDTLRPVARFHPIPASDNPRHRICWGSDTQRRAGWDCPRV